MRGRTQVLGMGSAYVRLLIGKEMIATRGRWLPHRLDKLLGWDYTLHASDFEIEVRPTRPVRGRSGS